MLPLDWARAQLEKTSLPTHLFDVAYHIITDKTPQFVRSLLEIIGVIVQILDQVGDVTTSSLVQHVS